MERELTKARRKRRPASACPNPLFVKWVEEWRDEAREEGSKVQYAYTKALNSLKKYPLPLVSGQEAKILDHIGEKLAKKLDKKLLEHRTSGADTEGPSCTTTTRKRPKLPSPQVDTGIGDENECGASSHSTKKGKKKRSPQIEYVPVYRSGPYALIIALHLAQRKPNWIGYLTKTQLMSQAQPHSDKSFTIPDDGKYYTAWSSMATLIRKGFVDKRSCPAKFRLTDAGEDMAEKLLRASASLTTTSMTPTTPSGVREEKHTHKSPAMNRSLLSPSNHRTTSPNKRPVHSSVQWSQSQADSSDDDMENIAAECGATCYSTSQTNIHPTVHTPRASFSSSHGVVLSPGTRVSTPITLSDSEGSSDVEILPLATRIAGTTGCGTPSVRGSQLWCVAETPLGDGGGGWDNVGTKRQKERKESPTQPTETTKAGSMTPAQMAGRAALCRLDKSGRAARVKSHPYNESQSVDLTADEERTKKRHRTGGKWLSQKKRNDDQEVFPDFTISKPKSALTPMQQEPSVSATMFLQSTSSSLPHCCASSSKPGTLSDCSDSHPTTKQLPGVSHTSSVVPQPDTQTARMESRPLFELKPGEFDVVLCVDNAESTASRKSNSQFRGILLQELSKNGVVFDVRKLNVGDFLWIAREKTTPQPGRLTLPESREAVLEYIIERKRMDDLAGSIIDGRFREQKFRLKHCGVRYPMYLVEEFKDALHLKLPLRSLEQAISNVQVIDEFSVHRTADIRESVAYLTLLTRQLQHHYANKTIQAFRWDTMSDCSKAACPVNATLAVEFTSFNEASVKNKTLTAYEMFGRHLMQVPGVSAERAAAILDYFPTVTALRDAYKSCSSYSEREALISKLDAGQNRKLGKSIGKIICDLYWRQ